MFREIAPSQDQIRRDLVRTFQQLHNLCNHSKTRKLGSGSSPSISPRDHQATVVAWHQEIVSHCNVRKVFAAWPVAVSYRISSHSKVAALDVLTVLSGVLSRSSGGVGLFHDEVRLCRFSNSSGLALRDKRNFL